MIYFTSDPHYSHANVINYCGRPYRDVDHMNESFIQNWNSIVKPEDVVYCLGDFSMAFRSVEIVTPQLFGTKYLVPGNHDFCHSYHKRGRNLENRAEWIKNYEEQGWSVLPEKTTLDLGDNLIVNMCHHPYVYSKTEDEDEYDDKYAAWRPLNDGKWLICGHVHEKWKTKDKMINVGVDVWDYKPVSIEEIKKLITGNND